MRKLLLVMLLLTNNAAASPEVDRGIESIKQKNFEWSMEARDFNAAPEFIFKHKNFSFDWIRADSSESFLQLKMNKKIFSLMGTGIEWNVALNAVDVRNNFYALPSGGINFYMRIKPRLEIYAQFSGLPLMNRGHFSDFESGIKYFPQKNLSISAGWRRIDFKLRRGRNIGTFERSGLFVGVRYDF